MEHTFLLRVKTDKKLSRRQIFRAVDKMLDIGLAAACASVEYADHDEDADIAAITRLILLTCD
jgi:hypothetical protein